MDYKHEGMAEWDQRQAFHERLHKAILHCHSSNFRGDYHGWYKALLVLDIELYSHLRKDDEKEEVRESMSKVHNVMNSSNNNKAHAFYTFLQAQKTFHKIMRLRGFDVPVNEHNPGHILRE